MGGAMSRSGGVRGRRGALEEGLWMVEGMERVLVGSQATTCRNIVSMRKKEKEEEEEEGKEEVAEVDVVAVAVGEKKGQVVEHLLLTSMRENCGQVY
jgi:hypothetical protein